MNSQAPILWIIAGPNGVGKTTYAKQYIRQVTGSSAFINQDEIARGISPLAAVTSEDLMAAARVSISLRTKMLKRGKSFTIETTLSGKSYLRFITKAKALGYRVNLLYFYVNSIEESLRRIQRRVESGGHSVSENDVRRRFPRSLNNFVRYAQECDHWALFDNNEPIPVVVADCQQGNIRVVREDLLSIAPAELKQSIHQTKNMVKFT